MRVSKPVSRKPGAVITPFLLVCWGIFFIGVQQIIAQEKPSQPNIQRSQELSLSNIQLKKSEALVCYLYHAGWAVKTAHTFLIFDYWEVPQKPANAALFDGYINPEEIKDLNVYVFVSHSHGDHFDESIIMGWKKVIPNITYIFGWKAFADPDHIYFGKERTTKQVGALKIKNIYHNFDMIPESAFLVEVDGLVIYFSGDHGNGPGELNPLYKNNIDYMAEQSDRFDLVFLSVFGAPGYPGELYALEKFKPEIMLPMHYGGVEDGAGRFISVVRSKVKDVNFWFPQKKGDRFLFKR